MRVPILERHTASRTEGLLDASYVGKRAILCPTAPLAPSFSAYCANKLAKLLAARQEGKSWSYLQQMMAARANPRRI